MSEVSAALITGIIMLVGLFGVVAPVLPDVLLIWGGALMYGLMAGWGSRGPYLFAAISILALAGALSEVWMSSAGARAAGASAWSVLAGLLLGVLGLFVLGPVGGLAGLLLGTFAIEYLRLRDPSKALRGMLGIGVGFGLSFLVKLGLGLVMIGLWLVWVFAG